MKTTAQNDYMNVHAEMLKFRHSDQRTEELKLISLLSDMWYVMSDSDQDAVNETLKELAYKQHG